MFNPRVPFHVQPSATSSAPQIANTSSMYASSGTTQPGLSGGGFMSGIPQDTGYSTVDTTSLLTGTQNNVTGPGVVPLSLAPTRNSTIQSTYPNRFVSEVPLETTPPLLGIPPSPSGIATSPGITPLSSIFTSTSRLSTTPRTQPPVVATTTYSPPTIFSFSSHTQSSPRSSSSSSVPRGSGIISSTSSHNVDSVQRQLSQLQLATNKGFNQTELEKLRTLSRLLGQLHINVGGCRRIQRGSPGAGSLSQSLTPSKTDFNRMKSEIDKILNDHPQLPGVAMLQSQMNSFDAVLNQVINERGYEDGYTDRVRYLEKINYECGQLKGMLDVALEGVCTQDEDDLQLDNQPPAPVVRRNLFCDDSEELLGLKYEDDIEAVLSSDSSYQPGDISINLTLMSNLCSNLVKVWEDGSNTDVTFTVGSRRVHAHRIVLAAQSEYFNSLLLGSMRESKPHSVIPLNDVSYATFQLLLRYAYSGRVQLDSVSLSGVVNLLQAADRFSFLRLRDALVDQLSSLISLATVIPLFMSAYNLNLSGLQKSCLQVADKNSHTLIKSDALLTLPADLLAHILNRDSFVVEESLIYDAVRRWMKRNSNSSCSSLVQCVRLMEMSQEKLVELSDEENKLFSDKAVLNALKIQVKPYWELRRPRGRKEVRKNLFQIHDCAKVDGSVTWRNVHLRIGNHTEPSDSLLYHGSPNVPLCNVIITYQQESASRLLQGLMFGSAPGSGSTAGPFATTVPDVSLKVSLDDLYLINHFGFIPYPAEQKSDTFGFSYTLEVSVDKSSWKTLIDYSQYTCYGQQSLPLPTIAVKFFRFKLCAVTNSSIPFTLCLKDCFYREQTTPNVIRSTGVQVPRQFLKILPALAVERWSANGKREHKCLIKLKRPILARKIRMKVDGSCEPSRVGDVTIYINNKKSDSQTFANVILKSKEIELSLSEETIVTTIDVEVIEAACVSSGITSTYSLSELSLKSEM